MSILNKVGTIYYMSGTYSINTKNGKVINKRDLYLAVDIIDSRTNEILGTSYLKFEFSDTKCDALVRFKIGDKVAVLFDIEGRFYDSGQNNPDGTPYYKHIQTVRGYNVLTIDEYKQRYGGQQQAAAPQQAVDFTKSLNNMATQVNVPQAQPQQAQQAPAPQSGDLPF